MKKTILRGIIAMVFIYCINNKSFVQTIGTLHAIVSVKDPVPQSSCSAFTGTATVDETRLNNMSLIKAQVYRLMY